MAFQRSAFQNNAFQISTIMPLPYNALQAGIYARLTGYSALTTALGGSSIYDHVPQGTTPPYVVIGDDTLAEFDNKGSNAWECVVTVHCWDYDRAGRKSIKTLMSHIYDALHRQESSITISGFSLTYICAEFQQTIQEIEEGASDHYYHGVQRFRALICETTT